MKYIKLFENFNEESLDFFDVIHDICEKHDIEDYTINDDGSIDVDGNVYLNNKELTKLPLKFRNVTGNFYCDVNELTTLEGSPKSVGGDFYCDVNELTSLEGCPISVGGSFYCSRNKLTSLEGCTKLITGHFYCYENKLTSLKGSPKSVGGDFNCRNNDIIDFIGFLEPGAYFYCDNNPIYNIWKLFKEKEHVELLNDYDCIRNNDIVIDRLNMFLEEIDKPTVKSVKGYNNI